MSKYEIERTHQRYGTPPTSMWTAIELEQGKFMVALVGLREVVEPFSARLMRVRPGDARPLCFPGAYLTVNGLLRGGTLALSVLIVGIWPDYDSGRAAAATLAGAADDGARQWALRLRKLARQQKERIAHPNYKCADAVLEGLAKSYVNECRRMASS